MRVYLVCECHDRVMSVHKSYSGAHLALEQLITEKYLVQKNWYKVEKTRHDFIDDYFIEEHTLEE